MKTLSTLLLLLLIVCNSTFSQRTPVSSESGKKRLLASGIFQGLKFRSIGPALTSVRIGNFAVHPTDRSTYYVAVASGGVWKTMNSGTTWIPPV